MSTRPLLVESAENSEIIRLRREISGLELELREARAEAETAKQASADAIHAIRALRHQLDPLFKSLKTVFGEISRIDAERTVDSPSAHSAGLTPKMEMMKRQLGGRQADFIDLLAHGPMTTAQLAAVGKCHRDTVAQVIHKLSKAQVIVKNGNAFSLRET